MNQTVSESPTSNADGLRQAENSEGLLGQLIATTEQRMAELVQERDAFIMEANLRVTAYNAVLGEKAKDLEALRGLAR